MKLLALRCTVKTNSPEKILSSLIASKIPFSTPLRTEDGFSFAVSLTSKRNIKLWLNKTNCRFSMTYEGLITPVFALKRRKGIIFGSILSLFLIYLSTFYVWSVRIEGNSKLSDSQITQLLAQCGFKEGIKKNSVDVNEIQNTVLARCHDLSFISVNVHGMVADVIVHERVTSPKPIDENTPYNLISDADGVIVSSLILDGTPLFNTGDTVFKGQLLVSGLMESTAGTTRLRHARGKIYARTDRTLTFEIPFERVERVYTNTEKSEGLRILGHSFYKKIADANGNYEVELEEKEVKLLGLLLPFKKEIRRINHYEEKNVILCEEEARQKAVEEYESYLSTELDSAKIIKEVFSEEITDSTFILTANVQAIENVATEKKIEITENVYGK